MAGWGEGYVADIDYTFNYVYELNPLRTELAFLSKGLRPPRIRTACELGFGQGLGTNIHAAASGINWWGTDFNPAQAGFAQELAEASGAGANLAEDAFEDYCRRPDLPDFDFIGLHGIWSWVSERNRTLIVDFIRRKLRPGGVAYLGYNAAPGWASFVPMRQLMKQYGETVVAAARPATDRIEAAIDFAARFLAANPRYAAANPALTERLDKIRTQDRHYLAHEYFNEEWHPMHFSDMPGQLAPAKLSFACSARYLDHLDGINLAEEQIAVLDEFPDPVLRESLRDVMVARRLRHDYWVKGMRRLTAMELAERLRAQRVILLRPRGDVPSRVEGALREAEMHAAVYGPVLDALADQQPRTVAEIEAAVAGADIGLGQVFQAVLVLAGDGHLAPAQDEEAVAAARVQSDRLNAHLVRHARDGADIAYLASPVTGGGIRVGRIQQLYLLARAEGRKAPADWVDLVWPLIAAQGQKIVKDGRTLETDEENRTELLAQAEGFAQKQLPVLRALGIC